MAGVSLIFKLTSAASGQLNFGRRADFPDYFGILSMFLNLGQGKTVNVLWNCCFPWIYRL